MIDKIAKIETDIARLEKKFGILAKAIADASISHAESTAQLADGFRQVAAAQDRIAVLLGKHQPRPWPIRPSAN